MKLLLLFVKASYENRLRRGRRCAQGIYNVGVFEFYPTLHVYPCQYGGRTVVRPYIVNQNPLVTA